MLFFEHGDAIFRGSGRCFQRVWTLFLEGLDAVFGGSGRCFWRVLDAVHVSMLFTNLFSMRGLGGRLVVAIWR